MTAVTDAADTATPLAILYVLAEFPVLSETFVTNEIKSMRRLGHHIVPLSLVRYNGPCQPDDEFFRAETLHLADISTTRSAAFAGTRAAGIAKAIRFANRQTGIPARSLLRAATRVAYVARQKGCTHIHAHYAHATAATAIAAAMIAGITCSFIGHGYDIYGTPVDLPLKLASADIAFAPCDDVVTYFQGLAPSVNAVMVPCGVDPDRFVPAPDAPSNGRLLAIGRLVEQKGYRFLFQALASIPAAQRPVLDIVGGGPLEDELQCCAAESGVADHVRFLGRQPSSWIAQEGPRYQGFVAPYVICGDNDRDTGPVSVKEALSMGLPVVASWMMGMKESVNNSCGRHAEPGNVEQLAAAIRWLIGLSAAERVTLGQAGRAHLLAHFTLAAQAAGITAAIRQAQGKKAQPWAA